MKLLFDRVGTALVIVGGAIFACGSMLMRKGRQ